MQAQLKSRSFVFAILGIVALAIVFWALVLSPKREEAKELGARVTSLEGSLSQHEAEIRQGEEAREQFPTEYQRLVVLGKAVPGDDDTASLLVQVSHIAERTGIEFRDIQLNASGGSTEAPAPAPAPSAEAEPASPTEASASLLPLGATIGPAGLGVMPYTLTFNGNFFKIADFIAGIDQLVKTSNADVAVDGRLVTLDAFVLKPDPTLGFPALEGTFSVTTYITPPGEGVTGGASPESPGEAVATPVSETLEAAP
jgi:Tfp pilus assembly protein PilO